METAKTIGYDVAVTGLPDGKMRESAEGYAAGAKILSEASAALAEDGVTCAYHNHSFEYQVFDTPRGKRTGMEILFEDADPPLASELDVAWVWHGRQCPRDWMVKLADRVPLLHMKDLQKQDQPDGSPVFAEIGTGVVDIANVVQAAPSTNARYFIVEQDGNWIDGDSLKSAKVSFENLSKIVAQA